MFFVVSAYDQPGYTVYIRGEKMAAGKQVRIASGKVAFYLRLKTVESG